MDYWGLKVFWTDLKLCGALLGIAFILSLVQLILVCRQWMT